MMELKDFYEKMSIYFSVKEVNLSLKKIKTRDTKRHHEGVEIFISVSTCGVPSHCDWAA